MEIEIKMVVDSGGGREERVTEMGQERSFWYNDNVLCHYWGTDAYICQNLEKCVLKIWELHYI